MSRLKETTNEVYQVLVPFLKREERKRNNCALCALLNHGQGGHKLLLIYGRFFGKFIAYIRDKCPLLNEISFMRLMVLLTFCALFCIHIEAQRKLNSCL